MAVDGGNGGTATLGAAASAPGSSAPEASAGGAPQFVLNLPPLAIDDGQETVSCANGSIDARSIDTVFVPDRAACQLNGTSLRGSIIVGTGSTLEAGGVALTDNRIDGNLQCKENIPAPIGGGNHARSKEDQCARL